MIQCESGGSYKSEDPRSTASGRYSFIDGTWNNFGGYSHASDAPPEVQDEKARQVWNGGKGRSHWQECGA
ncbi:MAG: transglycosylase family protein [Actinomycetota bacterium]